MRVSHGVSQWSTRPTSFRELRGQMTKPLDMLFLSGESTYHCWRWTYRWVVYLLRKTLHRTSGRIKAPEQKSKPILHNCKPPSPSTVLGQIYIEKASSTIRSEGVSLVAGIAPSSGLYLSIPVIETQETPIYSSIIFNSPYQYSSLRSSSPLRLTLVRCTFNVY